MKAAILIAALATTLPIPAAAQSMADQIACQAQAEKARADWAADDFQWSDVWVESHWNAKLHVCMALIHKRTWEGEGNNPWAWMNYTEILLDPVSGHGFAEIQWTTKISQPYVCDFETVPFGENTYCSELNEFDAAIQPYMAE